MKKKLLLGLSALALGAILSACEPEEVEIEEEGYVPGSGYEYVFSPSASFYS